MRTATTPMAGRSHAGPMGVTLLELVRAVGEVTPDEQEIIATVLYMLHEGHVRLAGNFRGSSAADFEV